MMPAAFVMLPEMPRTPNGKLDRRALPAPMAVATELAAVYAPPRTTIERILSEVWQQVLCREKIGMHDNFFDLGGHSLLLAQVRTILRETHHLDIPIIEMFRYPTVNLLARYLGAKDNDHDGSQAQSHQNRREHADYRTKELGRTRGGREGHRPDIAIIGMAGRFPGARNIGEFWCNLRNGVETISTVSDDELRASGADEALLRNPHYVKAGGFLDDIEQFDASFFGFNPREAEITDPQHRVFLECAWEVLENAGYDPQQFAGRIGLFAGESINSYLYSNIFGNPDLLNAIAGFQTIVANDRDFLATRVSYKLNLRGPSVVVQSACSTSLVAVHLACQSLLNGECDMALAGGVSVKVPHRIGYHYQESGIRSPDGHCRPFDAEAAGTVGGSGVGLVLLKRLPDALAEHDQIQALIKGSAINNDGSLKVGYTAPSVSGQAEVIGEALAVAGVEAQTISYVEAHGTATPLGDPVEVAALTQAFRSQTQERGFCALGSVKSNVGHLDAAAGVTGLIKTVLALRHEELPASLHYVKANPEIDFGASPFYVNAELRAWGREAGVPRRAGVSSFGIGGTNAHVVLEEAPEVIASMPTPGDPRAPTIAGMDKDIVDGGSAPLSRSSRERQWHLIPLSARGETTLDQTTARLVAHLRRDGAKEELGDVAFTLQFGRRHFEHRRIVVCRDTNDVIKTLEQQDPKRVLQSVQDSHERPIAFMFSGLGDHYVNMGLGLYREEPVFRAEVDHCAGLLREHLGLDIRDVLYPADQLQQDGAIDSDVTTLNLRAMLKGNQEPTNDATRILNQTFLTQPAVFVVEYALAKMWM
jgi:acyl transferase domain-containing protein